MYLTKGELLENVNLIEVRSSRPKDIFGRPLTPEEVTLLKSITDHDVDEHFNSDESDFVAAFEKALTPTRGRRANRKS